MASGPAHAQITVEYEYQPAADEAELFQRADVIVRGRIETRRIETPDQGPKESVYSVRILETLKSDGRSSVGGLIDVSRFGGFDSKTADRNFPAFEIGDEVVLFLRRHGKGTYSPFNGPDGAFKLTKDGRTHPYGKAGAVSKKHADRSADDFMAELRKHKR